MKSFTELYLRLDRTNKTNEKVAALKDYFSAADPEDAVWVLYFLSGRKPRQIVPSRRLREWAMELAGVPEWMFEECRNTVGDTAETIALLLPDPNGDSQGQWITSPRLNQLVEERLFPLRNLDEKDQYEEVVSAWNGMNYAQRFVYNKMIAGNFRVGVSQKLVMRSLSEIFGIPVDILALRMMGDWKPTAAFYESLTDPDVEGETPIARPYPFHLAHQLEGEPSELGTPREWLIEWKYDGIRCQAIKRQSEVFLWSRGEDLITDAFPEISEAASLLPDGTVVDGEILAYREGEIMLFQHLQRRIGRKKLSKKMLAEIPVVLMCYDLLEYGGKDIRKTPIAERRKLLEKIVSGTGSDTLKVTEEVKGRTWVKLESLRRESRSRRVEGFMLKHRRSPYRVGRQRGDWWKWKIDPFTVDAVMIYAQKGSGRRANLFTDYTFAVWDGEALVPFAKAYSGLTDAEIRKVDHFVRRNTKETFGPVRSVSPELVFEIAFEGIRESSRHKSGVAVRFPRMLRWRRDKRPEEADTLDSLRKLLNHYEPELDVDRPTDV